MRLPQTLRLALAAAAALAISACGSSSSSSTMPGRINVHLMDGPATQYEGILLNIQRVELATADGWKLLSSPNQTYDLLKLTNGVTATLVDGETIPAGHYTQMRLVLGQGNKVVLSDGSQADLVVPSGMQSGVKITCSFDVAPNTTADLFIDIDGAHSVFVHETGNGKYMLRPTVRAYDKVVTGSILGTVTAGGAPLADATVYVETLDANGNPTVVTHGVTGADGKYVIGLLPVATTYYVVGQPVVGGVAYAAKASGPIEVTSSAPTPTYDVSFDVAAASTLGSLTGKITPAVIAGQSDVVNIATSLDSAGTQRNFVVRQENGALATDETYAADLLPASSYTAWVVRTGTDDNVYLGTVSAATTVTAGSTATTLDLVAPTAP